MDNQLLVSFYLTAAEILAALEVNASLVAGGVAGDSYFLSFSGLRYEYDPAAPLLQRVVAAYLGDEVVGYSDTPLDPADEVGGALAVVVLDGQRLHPHNVPARRGQSLELLRCAALDNDVAQRNDGGKRLARQFQRSASCPRVVDGDAVEVVEVDLPEE